MSWQPAQEPRATPGQGTGLDIVIVPRVRDIGGFEVWICRKDFIGRSPGGRLVFPRS